MSEKYTITVHLTIREKSPGYGGLELSNTYDVGAKDILSLLKILSQIEEYTRKLATT